MVDGRLLTLAAVTRMACNSQLAYYGTKVTSIPSSPHRTKECAHAELPAIGICTTPTTASLLTAQNYMDDTLQHNL
jgi:hypothetical protein